MTDFENWVPIPGLVGRYEVSDQGRVRSLSRLIVDRDGRHRRWRGRILSASRQSTGYLGETLPEAFTAAVGGRDCPCGAVFEFTADSSLEDYAALNRWLGQHLGTCSTALTAERDELERARVWLDAMVTSLAAERDDLAEQLRELDEAHGVTLGRLAAANAQLKRMQATR